MERGGLMSSQYVMRSRIFMSIIISFLSLKKGAHELLLYVVAHFIIIINCLYFKYKSIDNCTRHHCLMNVRGKSKKIKWWKCVELRAIFVIIQLPGETLPLHSQDFIFSLTNDERFIKRQTFVSSATVTRVVVFPNSKSSAWGCYRLREKLKTMMLLLSIKENK